MRFDFIDRNLQKLHSNPGILTLKYKIFTIRSKYNIRKLMYKLKNSVEGKDSGWSWINRNSWNRKDRKFKSVFDISFCFGGSRNSIGLGLT